MKKTIIFDTITGQALGFSSAQIDPVATMKKVNPKLKKTPESKKLDEIKSGLHSISMAENQARFDGQSVFYKCAIRKKITDREMGFLLSSNPAKAKEHLNASEISEIEKHDKTVNVRMEESRELMKTINAELDKIKIKEKSLISSEAVYFGTRSGENILSDAEYTDLGGQLRDLKKGEFLKVTVLDGAVSGSVASIEG